MWRRHRRYSGQVSWNGIHDEERSGYLCGADGEWIIGAIVAVNALGDVIDVDTGKRIAGILNKDKTAIYNTEACMYEEYDKNRNVFSGNTTIGCVVTNAKLTKTQANKVASIAHNGFARAIRPVHTMTDGDTIFVLATGEEEVMPDAVGALAAEVMARAINRAVLHGRNRLTGLRPKGFSINYRGRNHSLTKEGLRWQKVS